MQRYSIIVQAAAWAGFTFGGYIPARKAAYQFLAEHQHCLPRNRVEAILYFRKRNYKVLRAFMTAGMWRGLQTGMIGAVWCATDYLMVYTKFTPSGDQVIDQTIKCAVKGSMSGAMMAFAGKGHRIYHGWRGVRMGLAGGVTIGLVEGLHAKYIDSHHKKKEIEKE